MRPSFAAFLLILLVSPGCEEEDTSRDGALPVRGIYGGVPTLLMEGGKTLEAAGVNAVWIGERAVTEETIRRLRREHVAVYAEFNTLHRADYLKEHPDAAPVGPDGKPSPAPHGWQGVCPTHKAHRAWRMEAFEKLITDFALDGVWLDYHHAHASWERADPALPDTCFCPSCLAKFQEDEGIDLGEGTVSAKSARLLGELRESWTTWRCKVFTDWVREFHEIVSKAPKRPLLGTFHCPWSDEKKLRDKLAIDLRAQKPYLDVYSPMPYHARFGHATDPAWISRQTAWLGKHLGVKPDGTEAPWIWPIVQLSDWGEKVPVSQIPEVLEHGLKPPSRGVIVFAWGGIRKHPEKVDAMVASFTKKEK